MPLIKTLTSVKCTEEQKVELASELSGICAKTIGKPETYVASIVEDDAVITFGGEKADAAFVEVKSIGGLNGNINKALSSAVCECLESKLGIPQDKVYINFSDVSANCWGWNGGTFG